MALSVAAAAGVAVCFASRTTAAPVRYNLESSAFYNWNFDGDNTASGGGGSNLADVTNQNPWTRKGDAVGLVDPEFGYAQDWVTGSAAMGAFPRTDTGNVKREFYQFRFPSGTTYSSWAFKADMDWAQTGPRMQNMGLRWRNDTLDTDAAGSYNYEGSLEGSTSSGSTDLKLYDSGSGFSNVGNSNNLVGQSASSPNPAISSIAQFSIQVQYNMPDDPGKIDIYYKSDYYRTGGLFPAGTLNTWNNNIAGRGNGSWVLVNSFAIANGAKAINEIALGGSLVNGFGQVRYDNVAFVPEPASFGLLGIAGLGLLGRRRRR